MQNDQQSPNQLSPQPVMSDDARQNIMKQLSDLETQLKQLNNPQPPDEIYTDPAQARIKVQAEVERLQTTGSAFNPASLNQMQPSALQDQKSEAAKKVDQNAPTGLSQDQVASIAQGTPAPGMPTHPSDISRVTQMSAGELQQFALGLEARFEALENRFQNLISENFKAKY